MPFFINSVRSLNWGVFKISQPKYHCGDFVDTLSTRTIANYTCGPYGQFLNENGTLYTMAEARCLWNKTWSPPELDPCKAICLHAHSFTDYSSPSLKKTQINDDLTISRRQRATNYQPLRSIQASLTYPPMLLTRYCNVLCTIVLYTVQCTYMYVMRCTV